MEKSLQVAPEMPNPPTENTSDDKSGHDSQTAGTIYSAMAFLPKPREDHTVGTTMYG